MLRLYRAGRAFAFGYFFALGALAISHYLEAWPGRFETAGVIALVIGCLAMVAQPFLERRNTRATGG